jgi:pimeloyl-ACP methyl ester carboxylesterase
MMAGSHAVLGVVLVTSILAVVGSVDPEVHMDAIELIKSKGYPAERHYVTTSDGYILQMHRIPYSKNDNGSSKITRPVFFLQHGLLCSSTNWLTNLANESFAFILSDAGFDVWMGNVRGNTYSRNHTHLTVHDRAFWDFTFDQHSLIDLPAMLTKTMEISTQNKLFYAGHSQGTIMGFAGFTSNKTLASHITAFFALAPVTTVKDVKGLFALVEYIYKPLEYLLDLFGEGEFSPNNEFIDWAADYICPSDIEIEKLCRNVIFLICGFDVSNFNVTRIPVYYSHTPAGTSVKNIVHYAQVSPKLSHS